MTEDSLPMVTVIAPCRNEAQFIENILNSILQGDYPAGQWSPLKPSKQNNQTTNHKVHEGT